MNMIMMQSLKLNLLHSTTPCPRSITCITSFAPSSSITVTLTHHQHHTYSSSSPSPIISHITRTHSHSHPFPEPDNDQVQGLRVPPHWSLPTNASKVLFFFTHPQFYNISNCNVLLRIN